MAKKVFSSYRSVKNKDAAETQQLIVELGTKHLACIVKSGSKETVRDFELFKFDSSDTFDFERAFDSVLEHSELIKQRYDETKLFINNENAVLVPSHGFNKENINNYLNIVYGEKPGVEVFVDDFDEGNINNVYRISKAWMEQITSSLDVDSVRHIYTNILEDVFQKASSLNGGLLKVVVYDDHIIATVFDGRQLKIIQTFDYQTQHDILYHLLNIAQQFNLNEEQTLVQLSGSVDVKFSLFTDLKGYFKRITFEEIDAKKIEIAPGDYPKHYFTPFFNLAK